MKRLGITLVFVGLMATLGGCKMLEQLKKSGQAVAAGSAAQGASAPSSQDDKDSQLNEKLEGYVYCLNYETRSAFRAREGYLDDVNVNKGPTGKESNISVQELSADTCLKRIDESKAKPPALADLDGAATDYKTALAELQKLTRAAHAYYDQKDYKDDKFAKGMAMHKPLVAGFDAFEKANKVFEEKLTTLNDAIGQRRLVRLKADPTAQLAYGIAKSVDDAKKLAHFAEAESLEKVDATGLAAALATYEESYKGFTSYADGHTAEADKVMLLSMFRSSSESFLKASKELMRRKRDNKGFKGEILPPEMIEGHPAQVLAKYNDMINSSNSLRFR